MKKIMSTAFLLGSLCISIFAQRPVMELTFTAVNNAEYVQLDSIKVINLTQGGDTLLYWPDTVLAIDYVGIPEGMGTGDQFRLFQSQPNPVREQAIINLVVPETDRVSFLLSNVSGQALLKEEIMLGKGLHSFRYVPGSEGICLLRACWRGQSSSIKVINLSTGSMSTPVFNHLGQTQTGLSLKRTRAVKEMPYSPGDMLLLIGFDETVHSAMTDTPDGSNTYTFEFAVNIPCPGTPTVDYLGQEYNTIQVYSQCWLKENLNAGTMIPATQPMEDNEVLEKYCYNNAEDSCDIYGGLYLWNEMMDYVVQEGARGICPDGWHIPTLQDWRILAGVADSQYPAGDPEWDLEGWVGFDAGLNLKSAAGWEEPGNGTDLFGFTALPAGIRYSSGGTNHIKTNTDLWTSEEGVNTGLAWYIQVNYTHDEFYTGNESTNYGFSVRCVRDE